MYTKLRELCLSTENQSDFPGWPFAMIFHGQEISREIFLLDPVLEYGVVDLGRNRVRDGHVFRYRHLNDWFHYQFFNGIAWLVNSAESCTLLPRLVCLERHLLEAVPTGRVHTYLEQELGIGHSDEVYHRMEEALHQITSICRAHPILVWGMNTREGDVAAQRDYIESVARIPADVVFGLPHIRGLKYSWDSVLKEETKALAKTVARYRRWLKHRDRQPRSR